MSSIAFKRNFGKLFCVATICVSLLAAPAIAAPVDDASKYIETVGNNAVNILSDKKADKKSKREKIERIFRDNVDINWIGRFVLGRFFRQVTDDQKKRYFKEYEDFLVQNYASRFSDYSGGSFKITGAKEDGDGEFTISMQIKSGDASDPITVDYRLRTDGKHKKFLIFDIIVEGVSMITTQRSEFSSVISNKGVDYLITQLAAKSTEPVGNGL